MSDGSEARFADRRPPGSSIRWRPLVFAVWIALKLALAIAVLLYLVDHAPAAVVYQRF